MTLDLDGARERFEGSTDFTVGLEEEFAILDPETLELAHRYEDVKAACDEDEVLAESAAGELIASEVEIRSGRGETFGDAVAAQQERRDRLFALVDRMGLALGAMGTHPWANYLDQRIIDTPHYNRLREELGYVAQRNNTWSLHVHVGVRGADRAIAVCDRVRELLPALLAASANSPFLDRRDSGLATVRSEIFTRTFPRCGVPSPFVDWDTYARFVGLLRADRLGGRVDPALVERAAASQLRHGRGADLRRADAGRGGDRARRADRRLRRPDRARPRRARGGGLARRSPTARSRRTSGARSVTAPAASMVDFRAGEEIETRVVFERLLAWTEPARTSLGIDITLPERNGAERARAALAGGRLDGGRLPRRGRRDGAHLRRRAAPPPSGLASGSRAAAK